MHDTFSYHFVRDRFVDVIVMTGWPAFQQPPVGFLQLLIQTWFGPSKVFVGHFCSGKKPYPPDFFHISYIDTVTQHV